MEKPYWAGQKYTVELQHYYCSWHSDFEFGKKSAKVWTPSEACMSCRAAVNLNEAKGFMKNTIVATPRSAAEPQKGTKYSFTGRPDFARIIRENPGADVIIISREDGLVTFLFSAGITGPGGNTLETLQEKMGVEFAFTYGESSRIPAHKEYTVPVGWAHFATPNSEWIKDLRKLAQRFVALRNGKHTVEVLP